MTSRFCTWTQPNWARQDCSTKCGSGPGVFSSNSHAGLCCAGTAQMLEGPPQTPVLGRGKAGRVRLAAHHSPWAPSISAKSLSFARPPRLPGTAVPPQVRWIQMFLRIVTDSTLRLCSNHRPAQIRGGQTGVFPFAAFEIASAAKRPPTGRNTVPLSLKTASVAPSRRGRWATSRHRGGKDVTFRAAPTGARSEKSFKAT